MAKSNTYITIAIIAIIVLGIYYLPKTGLFSTIDLSNLCYQESANAATSCGGLSTGSYSVIVSGHNPELAYDGNFDTQADGIEYRVTYMKPLGAMNDGTLWKVRRAWSAGEMLTIPSSCWNRYSDKIVLHIAGLGNPSTWLCENATGEIALDYHSGWAFPQIYEEAIYWNINQTIANPPVNVTTPTIIGIQSNATTTNVTSNQTQNNYYGTSSYNQSTQAPTETTQKNFLDNYGAVIVIIAIIIIIFLLL